VVSRESLREIQLDIKTKLETQTENDVQEQEADSYENTSEIVVNEALNQV